LHCLEIHPYTCDAAYELSAPEFLGDCHVMGFGEEDAGRKLFGHDTMNVILSW